MKFWQTFIFLIVVFIATARGQWVSDSTVNTPVCTAPNTQRYPQACSDGADGALIVWEDFRNGHDWDIYAQKLDANGVRQWGTNGVIVCSSSNSQNNPIVATDGSGGAYIVWEDGNLNSQHILYDGSYGYSSSGLRFANGNGIEANPVIIDDGKGNAYVAWEDSRTSIYPTTRPNIWMNKLTSAGAAWGTDGIEVIDQLGKQRNPKLISDGKGGCLLAWENEGSQPFSICASLISSDGIPQWPSPYSHTGKTIYGGMSGNNSQNVNVSRDGNQYLFAWEENDSYSTTKGWNILAQRINADGSFNWGQASTAPEISTDYPGDQINPTVFSDDSTVSYNIGLHTAGLMVVYEDYFSDKNIVFTRLLGDGMAIRPAYPNQLFPVCKQSNIQENPKAVKTGSGEILVAWEDERFSSTNSPSSAIYTQRIDKTPKRLIGPYPSSSSWGQAVSNKAGVTCDQLCLVPRTNGAIAVWRDSRNGSPDIYAQLIFRDGTLPIELSSFSVNAESDGKVLLNWQTASEKDNAGFEVERRMISDPNASNVFEVVGSYLSNTSLLGAGFSNSTRHYSFIDQPGKSGVYEYRLADFSLDGERTTHEPKTVEVASALLREGFSVGQNVPNPFNDRTIIPLSLSQPAQVELIVTDVLGRIIATPINSLFESGYHALTLNSTMLEQEFSSGAYYYSITIRDPQTNSIIWKMPKAAMMVKISN
jgi:hypothetical protein